MKQYAYNLFAKIAEEHLKVTEYNTIPFHKYVILDLIFNLIEKYTVCGGNYFRNVGDEGNYSKCELLRED
jgi:hypothetical protein